ncbi:MAG: hypothetical protein ACYDHA_11500 [Bellilinea sp.]
MKRVVEIIRNPKWYFVVLFLVGCISYIFTTSALGFYWDDWQAVFLYKTHSVQALMEYFKYDRPLSAWTYLPSFPFLPMTPLVWQIFTLLIRCSAVWLLTQTLILLWEDHQWLLRWFGVILLVLPSFSLQSISVAFNQHFITLLLYSFSTFSMVKAIQSRSWLRWVWGLGSLATAFGQMVTMEYFVGLEALRPILIWLAFQRKDGRPALKTQTAKTVLTMIPYFLILVGYLYWRLMVYPQNIAAASIAEPNAPVLLSGLKGNFVTNLIALVNLGRQDTVFMIGQSWLRSLQTSFSQIEARFIFASWGTGLIAAALFGLWLNAKDESKETKPEKGFYISAAILGSAGLIFGGLPVWVTNRSALVGKWSERFTLAPMIGAVLLIVILIDWFIDNRRKKSILFTVILGLSIAFQMQTTHSYAVDWKAQREYYWQIAWRVPNVKPGTAFLSGNVPSGLSSHHSAGFALNALYGGDDLSTTVPVWYLRPADVETAFEEPLIAQPIQVDLRSIRFEGTSTSMIGLFNQPAAGCLIVLDDAYLGDPPINATNLNILKLSNLDQIDLEATPVTPDPMIFGKEPEHDWCYFFQKADLARQKQKWVEVTALMDEAFASGLDARYSLEYLPLLEAQYHLQDWDGYLETSQKILSRNSGFENFLCTQRERIEREAGTPPPSKIAAEMKALLDCSLNK